MRKLEKKFVEFIKEDKDVSGFLNKLKKDSTIDFEIREDTLQAYYRGADLFSMKDSGGKYFFIKKSNSVIREEQNEEITKATINNMLENIIPKRKEALDLYKINGPEGTERETQQIMFGSGEKSHVAPVGKSQILTNEKNQNYPSYTSFLE